ncbi:unnamed protein product [Prunus armeniaca]
MDQIAPCIHDELALFVKKYRRVVEDKTKVTRNFQNLPSSFTCVFQDNVFKESNFLDSYGFREDKSLKDLVGLVKFYLCGGAGHIHVECANNHMTESNGREESISAQWSDRDSDDSNNYITFMWLRKNLCLEMIGKMTSHTGNRMTSHIRNRMTSHTGNYVKIMICFSMKPVISNNIITCGRKGQGT